MYNYETEKKKIFTDEGQKMFLKIRDKVDQLLTEAGAFQMGMAISVCSGDCWAMLACVDRLVELGEIEEVKRPVKGQYRIFVGKNK